MTHRSWSGEALSREDALDECRAESGRQFAPWAVAALERVMESPSAARPPARPPSRLRLVSAA
jgi:HD-GYP domain-containing protein (c-di-GMP phosphodiesterase class II)